MNIRHNAILSRVRESTTILTSTLNNFNRGHRMRCSDAQSKSLGMHGSVGQQLGLLQAHVVREDSRRVHAPYLIIFGVCGAKVSPEL